MRDWLKEWGSLVVDTSFALITLYLDHTRQLAAAFGALYPVLQPLLFTVIGAVIGYNLSRRKYEKVGESKDVEIARLRDELAHGPATYKRGMVNAELIDGLCADERRLVAQMYVADNSVTINSEDEDIAYRLLVMGALDNMSLYGECPVGGSSVQLSTKWRSWIANDADVRAKLGVR